MKITNIRSAGIIETPAGNEHIGEIAAVSPQKRQCEFGSYYPARTFVKPLPRQYATTLLNHICNAKQKLFLFLHTPTKLASLNKYNIMLLFQKITITL